MRKAIQIQYTQDFEDAAKKAARAGFKYVSIGFGSSDCFHHDDWERHVINIDKILNSNSLTCIQTHLPYYSLLISAEEIDKDMDRAMIRCLKAASRLGAEWTAYHARTAINDNYSPRKSMEYAKIALEPLVETAQKEKTGLAIENLPVFPGMSHMKFFSSDYEDICELYDYCNSEYVGICWDVGHAHLMKYNQAKAIEHVGHRIKATHIHNNSQYDDDHFLPSQGTMNWKEIMEAFKHAGYNGALTLEINYENNALLESFFKHALSCLEYLEKL